MKIRTKLILAVASPLVMLAVLAGGTIQESWQRSGEMDQIQRLGQFSTTVSALVHETQKERGATGGFLGSSDDSFRGKLKSQQNLTDERRADFDSFMADFEPADFGPEFAAQVESAIVRLNQLDKQRAAVLKRSIPVGTAIGYYTAMHASFLDCISKSVLATSDGPIAVKMNAYSAFLKSKERAGIERAVLTSVFAKDHFTSGVFEKFVSLVATQEAFMNEFLVLATPEDKAFLNQTLTGSAVKQVASARKAALEGATADSLGQNAVKWFDAATARINLLKKVDDYLADGLNATASSEADAAHASLWVVLLSAGALTIAVAAGGFLAIRSVLGRLEAVKERIRDIAEGEGDLTRRLETSSDEIGDLCSWFNALLEKIETVVVRIATTSAALADSADNLSATAESLKSGARDSKDQSTTIASAVQQMSANMVRTASASEEMSAGISGVAEAAASIRTSIGKIADRSSESAKVTQSASDRVDCGNEQITELKQAAAEIGEVIDVIQDIAEQTNLLALNATIESARAGDAGKGFAVVATEVKELACQTAKATDGIRERIVAIQNCTEQTISTMSDIDSVIRQVREVSDAIAAEVSQQTDQVSEIATAMQQSSGVSQEIAAGISESAEASRVITNSVSAVDGAVSTTADGAELAHGTSCTVAELAAELRQQVSQFKTREQELVA